jgi:hypothetical protein
MKQELLKEIYKWIIILLPLILLGILLYNSRRKKHLFLHYIKDNQVRKNIERISKMSGKQLVVIEETKPETTYIKWLYLVSINDIAAMHLYKMFPPSNISITRNTLEKYPTLLFLVKGEETDAKEELQKILQKEYIIKVELE